MEEILIMLSFLLTEEDKEDIRNVSSSPYTIAEKIESDRLIEQEMEDVNAFLDTLLN